MSSRHLQRLRVEHLEDRAVPATFTVTNTAASGAGSFAQAILDANANAGSDRIEFNIAPGGLQTIIGALPSVTDGVTIDGTTQPGYAGSPIIQLHLGYHDLGTPNSGLGGLVLFNHSGSIVRGLLINSVYGQSPGFDLYSGAVTLLGGGGHSVEGCIIGLDAAGLVAAPNIGGGVLIQNSSNNHIGGTTAAARNVISGQETAQILVRGNCPGTLIQGNILGPDITGASKPVLAGWIQFHGVYFLNDVNAVGGPADQSGSLLGGTVPGAGNVIAFNSGNVLIDFARGVSVLGNSIYRGRSGLVDLGPNEQTGAINDPGDTDTGSNDQQNYPVIASVTVGASGATVSGSLSSTPNRSFRIELFRTPDPSVDGSRSVFAHRVNQPGYTQGRDFVGATEVTTNAAGQATFQVATAPLGANDYLTATATDLTAGVTSSMSAARAVTPRSWFAVAPGPGRPPEVKIYNTNGALQFTVMAYEPSFTGGVRVAMLDVNQDGVLDLITGTGVGGGPLVKVFDGRNGALLQAFMAYESTFRGGVNVSGGWTSSSGSSEGHMTLFTGPGVGGGPLVRQFDAVTGAMITQFMAYDPAFRGGISVAASADLPFSMVTAPGPGGGPHIKLFSGIQEGSTPSNTFEFLAYDQAFRGGVNVSFADLDGDGQPEIVTAPGAGAAPQVKLFRLNGTTSVTLMRTIDAYASAFRGGVTLTLADLNADGVTDVLTGPGKGGGPHVRAFDGATGANILNFFPFDPSFTGGVFVG